MTENVIWIVYSKDCDNAKQRTGSDTAVPAYHFRDPEAAWLAKKAGVTEAVPAEYLVVAGCLTGDVNEYGAHRVDLDWDHAISCDTIEGRP